MKFKCKKVLFLSLLTFLLFTSSTVSVFAQTNNDIFTISGIDIDKTDENASNAKEKAIEEGQYIAFEKLVERLAPSFDISDIQYDKNFVSSMIKSFEIDSEELSDTRYIASLTFYFAPNEAIDYIEKITHTKLVQNTPTPVLILPIIRFNDIERGQELWAKDNVWYGAWKTYNLKRSFVPIKLPNADSIDAQLAPNSMVIKYDPASISKLMQRYQTSSSIIAILEMEDSDFKHILLHIYSYNNNYREHIKTIDISSSGKSDNILKKAVNKTIDLLNSDWKNKQKTMSITNNIITDTVKSNLVSNVIFSNMGEWIKIQKALKDNFAIKNTKIISLNAKNAKLRLEYIGNLEQLRLALQDSGLELTIPLSNNYNVANINNTYEIQLKN